MEIKYLDDCTFKYLPNLVLDLDPYYSTIRIGSFYGNAEATYYNKFTEDISDKDSYETY